MNETDPSSPRAQPRKRSRMKSPPDKPPFLTNDRAKIIPSYIVVSRKDENTFKNISPFFINKFITNTIGQVKNIKKLRDGNLLIETSNAKQTEKLLEITKFGDLFEVQATPHRSLNYSRGVIRCFDLQYSTIEEIKDELKDIITDVIRIKVKKEGVEKYTHTYILTFSTPKPPETIKIGFLTVNVQPYIPNPIRCYNCLGFSHGTKDCKKGSICANCGQTRHSENSMCENTTKCINCKGDHNALDRKCPTFLLQKEIKAIQANQKVSFTEAKKIYKAKNPTIFQKSYATIVKVNDKKDIGIQVDFAFNYPSVKPTVYTLPNIEVRKQTEVASVSIGLDTTSPLPLPSPSPSPSDSTHSPPPPLLTLDPSSSGDRSQTSAPSESPNSPPPEVPPDRCLETDLASSSSMLIDQDNAETDNEGFQLPKNKRGRPKNKKKII